MTDPLVQAQTFIERATEERAGLQRQLATALTESHQVRRQLDRARDSIAVLEGERARLEHELEAAHDRIERAERATREHVGRVG